VKRRCIGRHSFGRWSMSPESLPIRQLSSRRYEDTQISRYGCNNRAQTSEGGEPAVSGGLAQPRMPPPPVDPSNACAVPACTSSRDALSTENRTLGGEHSTTGTSSRARRRRRGCRSRTHSPAGLVYVETGARTTMQIYVRSKFSEPVARSASHSSTEGRSNSLRPERSNSGPVTERAFGGGGDAWLAFRASSGPPTRQRRRCGNYRGGSLLEKQDET
jgi:hypothetical protein